MTEGERLSKEAEIEIQLIFSLKDYFILSAPFGEYNLPTGFLILEIIKDIHVRGRIFKGLYFVDNKSSICFIDSRKPIEEDKRAFKIAELIEEICLNYDISEESQRLFKELLALMAVNHPAERKSTRPAQINKWPSVHVELNSKLTNSIFATTPEIKTNNNGQMYFDFVVDTSSKHIKGNQKTRLMITTGMKDGEQPDRLFLNDHDFMKKLPILPEEWSYMNAIFSLCYANNDGKYSYLTPQEIFNFTMGRPKDSPVHKHELEKLDDLLLNGLGVRRIALDISNLINWDKYIDPFTNEPFSKNKKGIINDYLLPITKTTIQANNNKWVTHYKIEIPLLMRYAYMLRKLKGQSANVLMIDQSLFEAIAPRSKSMYNTGYMLPIRDAVIKIVHEICIDYRNNTLITLKDIYLQSGITPPEDRIQPNEGETEKNYKKRIEREKQKDREQITQWLDSLTFKKVIKGYNQEGNRPIRGYRIFKNT